MAATRNFNGVSEDMDTSLLDVDMNDPDLEARLYGEIYYSNETYPDPVPQGSPSPQVNNSTAAGTQWSIDPQPGQSGNPGESHYPRKKKHRALIDGLPGSPFSQFSRGRKPEGDENNFRNQKTWDSQRVFPRGDSPRGSPPELQKSRKSREAIPSREKMTQNTEEIMEEDEEPDSTSLTALDDAMTANTTSESSREHSTPSRSPQNTPQEDSTFQSPAESQDDRKTPEESSNSKYKVQCKKSRKNPPSMIVEDSDDSILEVPVPPKPLPPLISLQDSDESSDESPVRMDRTPQEEESSESSSLEVIDEDTTTQLIINCTSVQKGVSSLAEIKRQRKERERNPGGQSDEESMTESEALNWGSLEGEIREEGELVDTEESVEVWEGIVEESDQRRNLLDESGSSGKCSEGMPLMVAEQRVAEDKRSEGQKRAHSGGSEESPRKKKKRERSMGLQEYLFQPMPKQLRDFYNEPRGGDIMKDIKEIQNAMPKHPSRWVVLDADLYPRPRKKRNTCAICQCEGHLRSRCPERPKVPTCHVCGIVGHSEPRCPESRKCFNCGKKWSTCRRTCEHCNSLQCSQCKGKGHCIRNCPDNWRKYHQTTTGESVSITSIRLAVMKPPSQLVCCHCIQRGHHVSTCQDFHTDNIEPIYEIIDIDNIEDSDDDVQIITPDPRLDEVVLLSDDSDDRLISDNDSESSSSISVGGESRGNDDSDDEVEVIPYVKPPIPTVCISDEDEVDASNRFEKNSSESRDKSDSSDSSSDSDEEINVESLDEDVDVEDFSDKDGEETANELIDIEGGGESNLDNDLTLETAINCESREFIELEVASLLMRIIQDVEVLNGVEDEGKVEINDLMRDFRDVGKSGNSETQIIPHGNIRDNLRDKEMNSQVEEVVESSVDTFKVPKREPKVKTPDECL
ncbi:uncharacterized protein [Fopius arisanus]|uniref:Zinc finger CCHC domain-containing protein 7 n=1 Tax=Fopius arisanus TaxID=64838 RepID=A0A9R1T836_9HYME|nr:PREDICTED: uncharacterized protein LOC105267325 isoform X2 [Fopius arisanus]